MTPEADTIDTVTQDDLTATQQNVINLLLLGNNQRRAAEEAGVAAETVSRWKASDAAFMTVLANARRDIWDSQVQRPRNLSGLAIDTLEGLLESEVEAIRLRDAQAILKAVALGDVAQPGDYTTRQDLQSRITSDTVIESGVHIYRNVTFGIKNGHSPVIRKGAKIASHSIVIGATVIGERAIVAPGAAVVDLVVPDGKIAAGVPARIVGDVTDKNYYAF